MPLKTLCEWPGGCDQVTRASDVGCREQREKYKMPALCYEHGNKADGMGMPHL